MALSGLVLNSLVCSEYHTRISSMRRVRLLRLWFISLESENEQTINKRNNKTMQRVNSRGETSSLLSKMPPALEREVKHIIESWKRRLEIGENGVNVHPTAPETGGARLRYKAWHSYKLLNTKYLKTHLFLIDHKPSRTVTFQRSLRF